MKIQIDKEIKSPKQFSKVWMTRWQLFIMLWLSIFFIFDIYLNQCEHLETLCITLVSSIIATMVPYFAKSFLETKQEKEMQYKYYSNNMNNKCYNCNMQYNTENNTVNDTIINNTDENALG